MEFLSFPHQKHLFDFGFAAQRFFRFQIWYVSF